jgi:GDP-mannose transporter
MASTYNLLSLADPEKGTSIRGSSAKSSPYETARESLQGTEPKSNVNAFMSCGAYTVCSVGMVMANKAISTSIEEDERKNIPQMSVICFQCIVAVIFVEIAKKCKYVEYPDFDWSIARAWLPLNILFIGMLATGFLSLVYNNVPMVTVFKNLTNVVTITGDVLLFKVNVSWLTLLSVGIMVLGAVLAGANDLEFSWIGYICMGCNCIFTAGYVLYMRFAATNINLPKFGMVYYNNLLSVMLLAPLIVIMGEIPQLFNERIMTPSFIFNNILAGFLGFYLNFASLWCVGATSATTYAIVGSLNKVPITILGFVMFNTVMTQEGIIFISLATIGGFMYAYAKFNEQSKN